MLLDTLADASMKVKLCLSAKSYPSFVLTTRLIVWNIKILILEVILVGHQHQRNFVVSVGLSLLDPTRHIIEWLSGGEIIDNDSTNGTPVVGPCDGLEWFLSSRVPYLQLDILLAQGDRFATKLNTDGSIMVQLELSIEELHQYAWFPNTFI